MTLKVRVLSGTISEGVSIPVMLTTIDDSAQGKNHCCIRMLCVQFDVYTDLHNQESCSCFYVAPLDYVAVTEVLTFTSTSTEQMVQVTIENDDLLEIDEVFRAMLDHELVNADDVGRVMLTPDVATVTILDDDSEYQCEYNYQHNFLSFFFQWL